MQSTNILTGLPQPDARRREALRLTIACTLLWVAACYPGAPSATQGASPPVLAPLIWTDKQDYAPGATALITGVGFATNETVIVQVLHADGSAGHGADHEPWSVTADAGGSFGTSWHVCEDDCLNAQLLLKATGVESGAQAHSLFTDSTSAAQVELQPGTIQGTVQLAGATVQSGYVYAYSQDGFSSSANFNGNTYSLTVAGDKSWRVQTQNRLQTTSDAVWLTVHKYQYVPVPTGATVTSDFTYSLGTIRGTISVLDGTLRSYVVYANASDANVFCQGQYSASSGSSTFSLPMVLNNSVSVYGSATIQLPSGTLATLSLPTKAVSVASSGVDVSWSLDLSDPNALGSMSGEVRLNGAAAVTQHTVSLSGNNFFRYQSLPGNSLYSLVGLSPGLAYPSVNSYFSEPYFYLRQPDPAALSNGRIGIIGGQDTQLNYFNDLAFVRGKLSLSGFYDLSKVNQAYVSASGISGTTTVNATGQDRVNPTTGAFDLALTPGPWNVYSWSAYFYDNSTPSLPLSVSYTSYDYTRHASYGGQPVPLAAGSDVAVPDFAGITAASQVILDVVETSGQPQQLITSASVDGYSNEYDATGRSKSYRYFYAQGPSSPMASPAVQIVAEPGTYFITARGYVNGSQVVFGRFPITLAVPQLTPIGANVAVQPSQDVPVSLTFENVAAQGVTTVTQVPIGPNTPPPGFQLGVPGKGDLFYDITTTAQFTGGVEVCISYDDSGFTGNQEKNLKLLHYNSTLARYEDITTELDSVNNVICGVATSFSVFTLAYSTDPEILALTLPSAPVVGGTAVEVHAQFVDSDPDDPHTATLSWGDGTSSSGSVDETTGTVISQHTYTGSGAFQVQLTLTDAAGNSVAAGGTITVHQAPIAHCRNVVVSAGPGCSADADINNGSLDPDGDAITIEQSPLGPYPVGQTEVTLTVTDSRGAQVSCVALVTVENAAPVADAGGPYQVDEGGDITLAASATDAEGGALTFEWDLDNDGTFETLGASVTFSAANLDGPSAHMVAVRVTDPCGASAVAQAAVAVLNVAPTISNVTGPTVPLPLGTAASVTVDFRDPCLLDSHSVSIIWDDGTPHTVLTTGGLGRTAGHTYSVAGVYTVRVTVTDDDTGAATSIFEYVVVYDPTAGFVTGGGWILSPAGAYTQDPSLTGKANFGFVSKYNKGSTVPVGETEFEFSAGKFHFHSKTYEWLVISGALAQYKGWGHVEDLPDECGFLLTATDGQITGGGGADEFRIKIWIRTTGQILYDNVQGTGDDLNSASPQRLGGGSISIKKAK